MENIHSTIVELGSIFKQLAEMVKEQEETVMRCCVGVCMHALCVCVCVHALCVCVCVCVCLSIY